jgi:hypothetical protein
VHDTLNPSDSRFSLGFYSSYDYSSTYIPMITTLAPWAWDDFTSAVTTTIHAVSWQGAYCRPPGSAAGEVPVVLRPFQISFSADNGRPPVFGGTLYNVTLAAADVRQTRAFEAVSGESDCAYFDHAADLPMPVPVTAGTRYWLLIRAMGSPETDGLGTSWGWRMGREDNGISANGTLHSGVFMRTDDLAFSLSSR